MFITLTTDMGLKDYYVATLKGAIYSELPDAKIIALKKPSNRCNPKPKKPFRVPFSISCIISSFLITSSDIYLHASDINYYYKDILMISYRYMYRFYIIYREIIYELKVAY